VPIMQEEEVHVPQVIGHHRHHHVHVEQEVEVHMPQIPQEMGQVPKPVPQERVIQQTVEQAVACSGSDSSGLEAAAAQEAADLEAGGALMRKATDSIGIIRNFSSLGDSASFELTVWDDLRAKEVEWRLSRKRLSIQARGRVLVEGCLWGTVDVDASGWTLRQGVIDVSLEKEDPDARWLMIFRGQ